MEIMTDSRQFGSDDREPYVGPQPVRRKFAVGQVHIFTALATHEREAHSLKMDRKGPKDAGLRSVSQGGAGEPRRRKTITARPNTRTLGAVPLTQERFPFIASQDFMHLFTKTQCGRSAPLKYAKRIHNP